MQNYMNSNEVYPIIDMINRHRQRELAKGTNFTIENPIGDEMPQLDIANWKVESFEVERDLTNAFDPSVIKYVTIAYTNGAVDRIELIRGLNPPVPTTIQDHVYINNLMIVEVIIETQFQDIFLTTHAVIQRENGYGLFERVDLTHS